jgi:transcription initiation factor TFIIIB Brf1 subunit/transcription initiation factor TFIIB
METFQEFANETPVIKKSLNSCFRTLVKTLNLRVPISNPITLIPQLIADLELNFDVKRLSTKNFTNLS